jgi:hypothetical protein
VSAAVVVPAGAAAEAYGPLVGSVDSEVGVENFDSTASSKTLRLVLILRADKSVD